MLFLNTDNLKWCFVFAFARSLQPRGLAETLCGSPLYMAPEIMQLQKYDAKVSKILLMPSWIFFSLPFWKEKKAFLCVIFLLTLEPDTGWSLECWCNSFSARNWKNPIHRKQSNTGRYPLSIFKPVLFVTCLHPQPDINVYGLLFSRDIYFSNLYVFCSSFKILWSQQNWISLQIAVTWVLSAKTCAENCCVAIRVYYAIWPLVIS